MDELNRIASAYFNAFEGRRHYPRLWSWQWGLCAATFVLWMISIWYYFDGLRQSRPSSMWVMAMMELIFIGTTVVIDNYKRRSLLSVSCSVGKSTKEQLDVMRKAYLSKAFGRSPGEFASIAGEAMAMVSMSERLRSQPGTVLSRFWRNVYDADHKDRLVGLTVGAAAILVSLIIVGLPPDSPSVIELAAADGFGPAMSFLFLTTAIAFGLWIAGGLAVRGAFRMSSFWGARLASEASFSQMKVRYMLQDLVRLHSARPEGAATRREVARGSQSRVSSSRQRAQVANKRVPARLRGGIG